MTDPITRIFLIVARLVCAAILASEFNFVAVTYGLEVMSEDWCQRTFKVLHDKGDEAQVREYWLCRCLIYINNGIYLPPSSLDSPTDVVLCGVAPDKTRSRLVQTDLLSRLTHQVAILRHGHFVQDGQWALRDPTGPRLIAPTTLARQHTHGDDWLCDTYIGHTIENTPDSPLASSSASASTAPANGTAVGSLTRTMRLKERLVLARKGFHRGPGGIKHGPAPSSKMLLAGDYGTDKNELAGMPTGEKEIEGENKGIGKAGNMPGGRGTSTVKRPRNGVGHHTGRVHRKRVARSITPR